jgi:hypothetical protein
MCLIGLKNYLTINDHDFVLLEFLEILVQNVLKLEDLCKKKKKVSSAEAKNAWRYTSANTSSLRGA